MDYTSMIQHENNEINTDASVATLGNCLSITNRQQIQQATLNTLVL